MYLVHVFLTAPKSCLRNDVIGDDLSTNDPADELEHIDLRPAGLGKFYGFPYCHTGWYLIFRPQLSARLFIHADSNQGYGDLPPPWNVTYPVGDDAMGRPLSRTRPG